MNLVQLVDNDIDYIVLEDEIQTLLEENDLRGQQQISLTSLAGNNDWNCSIGRAVDLEVDESKYNIINDAIKNTYIDTLIKRYSNYYRWRILILKPKTTYSIHSDCALGIDYKNYRLHIPVTSNPGACMMFFDPEIKNLEYNEVFLAQLKTGNSYRVNTSGLHTAVNFGDKDRIHIVGVRYSEE
jgi:hypothetical protein